MKSSLRITSGPNSTTEFETAEQNLKAISKTRNTGTPEQHQSGTRNTGTLKILNLLRFEKKNTGGVELLLE